MAHRYRLCPSPAQLPVLRAHCGQACWVWNDTGLNRAILDQGWGRLLRRLEDKAGALECDRRRGRPGLRQPDLCPLRACGEGEPREPSGLLLRRLRAQGPRGLERAANILARAISSLAPTPGYGAGSGDRAARRSPALAGSESLLAGAVA